MIIIIKIIIVIISHCLEACLHEGPVWVVGLVLQWECGGEGDGAPG